MLKNGNNPAAAAAAVVSSPRQSTPLSYGREEVPRALAINSSPEKNEPEIDAPTEANPTTGAATAHLTGWGARNNPGDHLPKITTHGLPRGGMYMSTMVGAIQVSRQ